MSNGRSWPDGRLCPAPSGPWATEALMARDAEWIAYFSARLAEAEKELAGFENCVAKHGLRVFERDVNGERDVTGRSRKMLQDAVQEYRRCLRDE